jgi:hypothetical protein
VNKSLRSWNSTSRAALKKVTRDRKRTNDRIRATPATSPQSVQSAGPVVPATSASMAHCTVFGKAAKKAT